MFYVLFLKGHFASTKNLGKGMRKFLWFINLIKPQLCQFSWLIGNDEMLASPVSTPLPDM